MHRNVFMPVAAGLLLMAAGTAGAASKTTTFGVSATVASNCSVSATALDFGSYDTTALIDATSTIGVRCSNGTPYSLQLSTGGGTYAQRLLSFGSNKLQYNLFTTAARTTVWGDTTGGTGQQTGTGGGLSATKEVTHTVYGQLPNSVANQDAPTGSYTDTITVTVTY